MTRSSFLKGGVCPLPAHARSQVLSPSCRKSSRCANNARRAVVVAAADFWKSALAVGASITLASTPAGAIGPEMFPLDVTGYEVITCPEGVPKSAGCIKVQANVNYGAKKPAFNSEVFGRARLPSGENAIYGAYAEASDAGKVSDIAEEINDKSTAVKFIVKVDKVDLERKIELSNFKLRTYPGMRADFRVIKPVSDGNEECEEASFGLECPEELPF